MIYGFEYPHKVGTVCGPGCQICDSGNAKTNAWMTDQNGNKMPLQPVFIIREATYHEYVADLRAAGGVGSPVTDGYYYEISTD